MEKSERVKVKLDCAYCGFSGTVRAFPTQNKRQCPVCHELLFLRYATGERGELAQAHLKNRENEGMDAVGDILVVLTIYCQQKGWSISDCFQMAWDEIKNRKGKMVNGSYVKEQDLIGDVDGL